MNQTELAVANKRGGIQSWAVLSEC